MAIERDRLRFLIFDDLYLRFTDPKIKRKAFTILEAAITCFARKGWDETTIVMVAREAGISRSLINHYFKNVAELRVFALKYIRLRFQTLVLEKMKKGTTATDMLSLYVTGCFDWLETSRTQAVVWFSFLTRCTRSHPDRRLNTEAVDTGTERLQQLITQAAQKGELHCDNPVAAAEMIQVVITGTLVTLASENCSEEKIHRLKETCVRTCLAAAGARGPIRS